MLTVRYVLSWTRTRRAVACATPVGKNDLRYTLLPKCARLREGAMAGAPLTFGAVRPTVVLPPELSGAALDCVLAHEGVHARRRDNLWHYVMAAALALYWWNPAVWLMARLLRRDIELSCDRAALKKLGADRRADYANTLVSLATQAEGPAFCQTFGRKAAEERILSVMKFKKTSVIGVVLSLVLVLAVTAAFASDPKEPDSIPNDGYSSEKATTSSAPSILQYSISINEDGTLKDIAINLDFLERNLAQHVANGTMTQDKAGYCLARARAATTDGSTLSWTFQPDSGLYTGNAPGGSICYKDKNGDLIPIDPATVVSTFIFPSGVDQPNYVPPDSAINPDSTDGGYTLTNYNVKFPTFDEDGNPISENGGIIGHEFYDYDTVRFTNGSPVAGGSVRTSSGLYDLCESEDCAVPYDHCHLDGRVVRVYYENPGLLCAHPDCEIEGPHEHDGVQYADKAGSFIILNPDLEPVPSAAP